MKDISDEEALELAKKMPAEDIADSILHTIKPVLDGVSREKRILIAGMVSGMLAKNYGGYDCDKS